MPEGIPIVTIVVKMAARETAVDEVPITSDVAILERKSHKRYPENIPTMFSI